MIQRLTSKELMELFEKSQHELTNLHNEISVARDNIETETNIIRNILEYTTKEIQSLSNKVVASNLQTSSNIFILTDTINTAGLYDSYGVSIHPKLLKTPRDIFNIKLATGYLYKNNATVSINGKNDASYLGMLMNDTIENAPAAFGEFDSPELTISIKVNPNDLLGDTKFNTIELLPYIPGSFSIKRIDIYTMQDYKTKDTLTPSVTITPATNTVGPSRILLDTSYLLYKIDFQIELKFKNGVNKYPFGLRHVYFTQADYNPDSYIILPIERETYIDYISEDIIVTDQYGKRKTTCKAEGIEIYMFYNNGSLDFEVATSKGLSINTIPKNVYNLFVKVPITKGISTLEFTDIRTR